MTLIRRIAAGAGGSGPLAMPHADPAWTQEHPMNPSHVNNSQDDAELIAKFHELRVRMADGHLDEDQMVAELDAYMRQRAHERNADFRKSLERRSKRLRATVTVVALVALVLGFLVRVFPHL